MNAAYRKMFAHELFDHDWSRICGKNSSDEDDSSTGPNQPDRFERSSVGSRAFDHCIEAYRA
jgi:hypothetical protein